MTIDCPNCGAKIDVRKKPKAEPAPEPKAEPVSPPPPEPQPEPAPKKPGMFVWDDDE